MPAKPHAVQHSGGGPRGGNEQGTRWRSVVREKEKGTRKEVITAVARDARKNNSVPYSIAGRRDIRIRINGAPAWHGCRP